MANKILNEPIIFGGGEVVSFGGNFGFNTSPSTLDVVVKSVAEDSQEFDISNNTVGKVLTLDISSFSPSGNFSFTGIITSIKDNYASVDLVNPVYSVQLSDPRIALNAIKLVLAPNPGSIELYTDNRIIDVYNLLVASDNSNINISSVNDGGINALLLLYSLGWISGDSPIVAGQAPQPVGTTLISTVWGEKYAVEFLGADLINPNFKVSGDVISITDLFQQIAEGNSFDWYVETVPSYVSGDPFHLVRIKTINRAEDNTNIEFQDFLNLVNADTSPQFVSAATSGVELREDPTGALIISDRKEFLDEVPRSSFSNNNYYALPIEDNFFSYNGLDQDRMIGSDDDTIQLHRTALPIDWATYEPIPDADDELLAARGYYVDDDECRAALAGFENWLLYVWLYKQNAILGEINLFDDADYYNFDEQEITDEYWDELEDGFSRHKVTFNTSILDFQKWAYSSSQYSFVRRLRHAHEVVSSYASNVYGRVFTFRQRKDASVVNSAVTRQIKITSFGSGDNKRNKFWSGWNYSLKGSDRPKYQISGISGSSGAGLDVDNFFDDGNGNGRTEAYAFFAGIRPEDLKEAKVGVSESPDSIYFTDDGMYVSASVSDGLFKISPVIDIENTPCVIGDVLASGLFEHLGIEAEDCYNSSEGTDEVALSLCADILDGKDNKLKMFAKFIVPTSVFIPYKHKKEVWATYSSYITASGTYGSGPLVVETDSSLSPANYSNFNAMADAGYARVAALSSTIISLETGSVQSSELPLFNLGDRIGRNANITSVSVSFSSGGISTSYNLESYLRRYGKKTKVEVDAFAKLIKDVKKQSVIFNSELTRINADKIRFFEDTRTTANNVEINLLGIEENPFGCGKIYVSSANPNNIYRNELQGKNKTYGVVATEVVGSEGSIESNLPNVETGTNVNNVSPNSWNATYGTDNGMFFAPFNMGVKLPDGGPETYGISGEPSAGDLNPFKPVEHSSGKTIMPFKQIVDGPSPVHTEGLDINSFRAISMKAPMMLSGWGYDIDGQPTFNSEDEKLDYTTWKVGPVDFRWDDTRKVWVVMSIDSGWGKWDE